MRKVSRKSLYVANPITFLPILANKLSQLHGHAQEVANSDGITNIEVTISHCDNTAIAVALASKKNHGFE